MQVVGGVVRNRTMTLIGSLFLSVGPAEPVSRYSLEEPYGTFGGMNPTGHAAVYLSSVCADSPTSLRRCNEGEDGVVISRYHRVGGYDWLAIPLLPYLYAVIGRSKSRMLQAPMKWRRYGTRIDESNLESIVPDAADGSMPHGDWIQLVGAAYDRTTYAFAIQTTQAQDDAFIRTFNARRNTVHFNILFHNCADFARQAIDFYYPHAIHRSFLADAGIMTPKQAAKSLANYSKHHKDLRLASFVIPQVPGTIPRSRPVRGVFESLVRSKRYAVPLVSVAVLHPYFGGVLAFDWLEGSHFDPRRIANSENSTPEPAAIENELHSNAAHTVLETR